METLPNGNIIERKWLVYSPRRDAMFCLWCFLFGVFVVKKSSGGSMAAVSSEWAQEGLSNWKNALHTIKEHAGSSSHCASAQFKELFLSGVRIDELLETGRIQARKEREQKIQKNREVLRRIFNAITFMARQNIPFRGHRENDAIAIIVEIFLN